ncbi:MAG: GNAT family N-acetyltransferase [Leptolyngbyaceae cyanobacterium bins.302]|nr:GNAT family N-acetyltransferase [Leptolyngbyaceae cyanobacterium bins.302]
MQLHRFEHTIEFCDRVEPFLLQDEVVHNLLLRLCKSFRDANPRLQPSYLAVVEDQERVVAVAIRTPPHSVVLSLVEEIRAIDLLAADLKIAEPLLPGVNAPQIEADLFAEAWQQLTHCSPVLDIAMRIHQLTTVQAIAASDGALRLAGDADLSLLADWYIAFQQEALNQVHDRPNAESWANQQVAAQTAYFWQDGDRPVSVACGFPASDQMGVINFVYTPPQHRKQGYATACVAALSQRLLDQGYSCCALFTDQANPTSNKIYRAIGYLPVCDWHQYKFVGSVAV